MGGSQPQRWAAAAPGGGDVAYRMQSLTYKQVELGLDESVPLMTLVRLFVWALIASFGVLLVFGVLFLIVNVLSDPNPFTGATPGGSILVVGYVLSFVAYWVVLLGARIDEPIGEWKVLLEDKWAAADSAYAAIYGSLGHRVIPVNANAMRIRSDVLAPEVVNNRLVITERSYAVYVSVFPYGTSLYVGWTMWRSRRGTVLIGYFVKDLIAGLLGRGGSINQMLRTERVRAMREAVHFAVREGVEVAVQGIAVPIASAFGRDLPIQDLRAGSATAGPAPVPPGQPPPSFAPPPEQSNPFVPPPEPSAQFGPPSAPPGPPPGPSSPFAPPAEPSGRDGPPAEQSAPPGPSAEPSVPPGPGAAPGV